MTTRERVHTSSPSDRPTRSSSIENLVALKELNDTDMKILHVMSAFKDDSVQDGTIK